MSEIDPYIHEVDLRDFIILPRIDAETGAETILAIPHPDWEGFAGTYMYGDWTYKWDGHALMPWRTAAQMEAMYAPPKISYLDEEMLPWMILGSLALWPIAIPLWIAYGVSRLGHDTGTRFVLWFGTMLTIGVIVAIAVIQYHSH